MAEAPGFEETAMEYRKRMEDRPSLRTRLYKEMHTPLEGKNEFDVHLHLVRQIREAFESGDRPALERIPQYWGNNPGSNSVTFHYKHWGDYDEYGPFDNETSGDDIYWVTNTFWDLENSGGPTEFYAYLSDRIEKFEHERDALCDEIMHSQGFEEVRRSISSPTWDDRKGVLRTVYRDEEFLRSERVVSLCYKAEHIYGLASDLLERLRDST